MLAMPPDHRSNPPPSESSASSSRASSPSIVTMSDFGNVAPSLTANSSTTSLVIPSEGTLSDSPSFSSFDAFPFGTIYPSSGDSQNPASSAASSTSSEPDVDPSILEALRSKDRIYVLRLGELMEELINDKKCRAPITAASSYQRMLLHRCSTYYRLRIEVDSSTKELSMVVITESRIPIRRLADLVPPEQTPQQSFTIIQRSPHERRVKPQSHAGSVTGEDADYSDIEPSETGSIGGRSSASASKKWKTLEEREAAYNEARSRIFMDFDEKKDKDMSASSSSASLASSSTSSIGDAEDSYNHLATESDRSGSSNRKDLRRGNKPRPTRSTSSFQPLTSSGSGSSRNSRAPSPSFSYPSLYEPPPNSGSFEPVPAQQYSSTPYPFPYSAPTHPNHPFMPPYPGYYYPYAQPHPPMPPSAPGSSEPSLSGDMYQHRHHHHPPPPPHQTMYSPYLWQQGPQPNSPAPGPLHTTPLPSQNSPNGPSGPPTHHPYPPSPFMPQPPGYGYPMPGYYTPPGDHSIASPRRVGGHLFDERSISVPLSAMGPHTSPGNLSNMEAHSYLGDNIRHEPPNGNPKPRSLGRISWSYGPGIGIGGPPIITGAGSLSSTLTNGETTGPRLHSIRRQSNTSNGSSSGAYRSSNSDEVSSIASSSTSSSSRRTYTSTSSSQHPLPPRPDWAVGLKPDPTLHATNRPHESHHTTDNNARNITPVSPRGFGNSGHGQSHNSPRRPAPQHHMQSPPMSLHSNDFPPLPTNATPERRPAAGNVWSNAARSVIMSPPSSDSFGPPNAQGHGNVLVHHPHVFNVGTQSNVMDDLNTFQRPPPKAAELFNPKMARRRSRDINVQGESGFDVGERETSSLSEQVKALSRAPGPAKTNTAVAEDA
ncbi:hypothetical protein D9757_005792 [Collybiopsis confluens]|uniref:SUZ domain-containing protein n=1 Tax=Collybiopsis confluens TaxID=2823264 RepID=A0A8H5HQD1_9AGAR|nr:hypothetical protein D9757_005792 [Collybiopsis confluens]